MILYETTAQIVPVLMIALFLDTRTATATTGRSPRSKRLQNRVFIVLCVGAFSASLLIIAGVLLDGVITQALVIAALIGCIALMAEPAWRRSAARRSARTQSDRDPIAARHRSPRSVRCQRRTGTRGIVQPSAADPTCGEARRAKRPPMIPWVGPSGCKPSGSGWSAPSASA